MPKMKTKSGAKKRFTFTGSGKLKRKHAYKSHILTKKSKKRKRNLGYFAIVDKADDGNIRSMLGK
ncbi:MAG: 50S ribosomal protein L35 [Bacteroidales bacterium]|nr:50S ribosomal protein L35 [Bacteroidales bacterium]MCF8405062.1 50S ribosomal protein L35 [Bacteroidales bacterium]